MAPRLINGSVVLHLLSLLAVFALHIVAVQNGMLHKIVHNLRSPRPTIPGTTLPLQTSWTNLKLLDHDFSIMVSVFEAVLDTDNLSLFVQANHFFGLWMSIWISILLESHRRGLKGISRMYVGWGLLMEFAGVAVGAPAWFATHLAQAIPFSSAQHQSEKREAVLIPSQDLRLLPWSYLIGLGVPTLGMIIARRESTLMLYSNQLWILIRLFHPVLVFTTHRLLRVLSSRGRDGWKKNNDETAYRATRVGHIYSAAFWLAAGPHLLVLFAVATAFIFPALLPTHVAGAVSVASLWPVASIWQSLRGGTQTIQSGIATFMTANEVISSAAFLIWALILNRQALHQLRNNEHLRIGLVKLVLTTVVFGPGAAAVTLLRNREEVIVGRASGKNKNTKRP